ncbi:hypothetical protein E2P81_ATG03833 [Venturia nashicola]|uniref:Uncharacterized protein n=1 Tax=Venturia nashicola TaxID=86259 RepID=A0A4Z1PSJ3_9PEZI|nr:hypothetical protein E6O75_ATG03925 [Venturia nashicola]TLD38158.1 hypothetical protein E2P81_ATG03833 [Venturia nashicola]
MPWAIEKRTADVHENRVSATSERANTIAIPVHGLLKACLEIKSSKSLGSALVCFLHDEVQTLSSGIAKLFRESFNKSSQYKSTERPVTDIGTSTDTAAEVVIPYTRGKQLSGENAFQQWRAKSLQDGDRELDVEDLEPLPPSAGLGTRIYLNMHSLL